MKFRAVSVFRQGWFAVVTGFLFFNVATANAQEPTITGISPSSLEAGGPAFTLTVYGTNFTSTSLVQWNGTNRTTTFVDSKILTAAIPAADTAQPGTATVRVTTGTVNSNSVNFVIIQAPTIASITPASAAAGGPTFVLTVTGTNFSSGSFVLWNGAPRFTTVNPSGTMLDAAITAQDIAAPGTAEITVFNILTTGLRSNVVTFTITGDLPTITSISPSSAAVGGPSFTLSVTGTNFTSTSGVRWNGLLLTTTFVDSTRLTAVTPAFYLAQPGTATVQVANSNSVNFAIMANAQPPTIARITPASAAAGGAAFRLTVTGTNYNGSSVVRWNGSDRPTSLLNPQLTTTLDAGITALDIASPGTAEITVFNPGPTGGRLRIPSRSRLPVRHRPLRVLARRPR